jgi:hypothetical protein
VLFDVLGVDDFGPRAAFDQLLQFLFALDQRDSSHNNLLDERESNIDCATPIQKNEHAGLI